MPVDTSAELSPNDSPFQSPTSPLQAINPPPVNSISAPAAAESMNAPPAGQTPTSPSATPEPNPIPTATMQLSDTGSNLELQIQRIIEREVQNAVAKAMDAMLPTIAPHFTVSSPSSVASANGTTNETVVIPRPDLTNNTATSDPSTVASSTSHLATNIMSQPQSSTVTLSDAPASKLVNIRKRLQDLDQKLAPKSVKLTDIARIHEHLAVIHDPNSKLEQLYGEYYDLLWSIPVSERSKEEKNALKQFEIGSLPSHRSIDSRVNFRMWMHELLYFKLKYYIPDLIIGAVIKPAAQKTQDTKIIQAARVALQTLEDSPIINWQVLVDLLTHLDKKPNIYSLEAQVESQLNSDDYIITKVSALHGLINLQKHDVNVRQWIFIWKLILDKLPSLMEQVLATTTSTSVRSTLGEINYTPKESLHKLNYQQAEDFISIWDITIVALKEKVMLSKPFDESDSSTTTSKSTANSQSSSTNKTTNTKSNNRSGLQCTCCGRKFHTADKCRILATLINAHKVTYKDGKYTSFYGKTTYK
ncbi:hypothetical protein MG1_05211, partial [Candida albicans GC75]